MNDLTNSPAANRPAYFTAARGLKMERDAKGVLLVTINDGRGGPITFTAQDHTEFTEAFYRIAQDRDTKVVILAGTGDYMAAALLHKSREGFMS